LANRFCNNSWAIMPACGKPYIPLHISQYMYPSFVTNS
jgi:hypothetical protein